MSRSVSRFALVVGLALLLAAFASRSASRGGDNQAAEKPSSDGPTDAQKPTTANESEKPDAAAESSARQAPVELALAKKVNLDFVEVPLKDFAKTIGAMGEINVLLDDKALTDAGVNGDAPITCAVKQIALRNGLRLILQQHELNYFAIADNVLLITTDAKAKEHVVVRLYDIRDLNSTPPRKLIQPEGSYGTLPDLITSSIAPTTWTAAGGTGSITVQNGILVVSQTQEIQEQLNDLLAKLRLVREQQRHGPSTSAEFLGESSDGTEEKTRRLLETRRDFDFTEVPLKDVAELLKKDGLEVQLDEKSLTDAGVTAETPISFRAKHVRLDFALTQLLQEHELNYIIDHEVLLITTDAKAKEFVTVAIYPVADLVADAGQSPEEMEQACRGLIESITTTIAPTTWNESGGTGSIDAAPFSKALVIAQTREVHQETGDLLTTLRSLRDAGKKPGASEHADARINAPVVKVYQLSPQGAGAVADYAKVIRDLLVPTHPNVDGSYVGTVPGAIVVRAQPTAHEQIRELLNELRAFPGLGGAGDLRGAGGSGGGAGFGSAGGGFGRGGAF
ncbi:MAG TPA: hypothetical protein VGY55_09545 [Pirellulales bacterium]|jgi:hypothetical protein|nr:hypothetical protein [Pirellulales bacterium]